MSSSFTKESNIISMIDYIHANWGKWLNLTLNDHFNGGGVGVAELSSENPIKTGNRYGNVRITNEVIRRLDSL